MDQGPQVRIIRNKSSKPARVRFQHRPTPGILHLLPDYFFCLSAIQILHWFVVLWSTLGNKRLPSYTLELGGFSLHWLFHEVFDILSYRRPPDLYLQAEEMVFQVQQHSWASQLSSFILPFKQIFCLPSKATAMVSKAKAAIREQETVLHLLAAGKQDQQGWEHWSSDSHPIVIDSATSKTITPYLSDLLDPEPCKIAVAGIGKGTITHKGKVKWAVLMDDGKEGFLEDHEAYYCKEAPYRLLCPHSWKKCQDQMRYGRGETEGDNATFMLAGGDEAGYILVWNRGQHSIHVPLDSHTNLPTIGGYGSFNSFQTFANAFTCLPTTLPDGDDQVQPSTMQMESSSEHSESTSFDLPTSPTEAPQDLDKPLTPRDESLFLSWHIKLGH